MFGVKRDEVAQPGSGYTSIAAQMSFSPSLESTIRGAGVGFRQSEYLGVYTQINNFLFLVCAGLGRALGATQSCVLHFLIAGAAGTKNGHSKGCSEY